MMRAARALAALALAALLPGCVGSPFAVPKTVQPAETRVDYSLEASATRGEPGQPVTVRIEMANTGTKDVLVHACIPVHAGVFAIGPTGERVRFQPTLVLAACAMLVPFSPGDRLEWSGEFTGLLYGDNDRTSLAPEGTYTVVNRYGYFPEDGSAGVPLERTVSFYWDAR